MGHSKKAATSALFTYLQFTLAFISGIVLFPLLIRSVGAYNYGLWLATGEAISYIFLTDLGVFAVLPWLIAHKAGSGEREGVSRLLSDSFGIGGLIAVIVVSIGGLLYAINPMLLGVSDEFWEKILNPMLVVLFLSGCAYPLKVFQSLLVGVQDVYIVGGLNLFQHTLQVAITICVIHFQMGIMGLALITALPPFANAIISTGFAFYRHRSRCSNLHRPTISGVKFLFHEGFGAWLGGLGVRLMSASNGIILTGVRHPDLATVYASTGKIAQILTPLCSAIPDGGLVGVSHIYGVGDKERTRRSVLCLLLLYLIPNSIVAIGLLIANGAFVRWWIGDDLYAGDYVNALLGINLILTGLAGGTFKLVSVIGKRQIIGLTTLIAGLIYLGLGFVLTSFRGLAGLAETNFIVWVLVILPVGLFLIFHQFGISIKHVLDIGILRWGCITFLCVLLAIGIGTRLGHNPLVSLAIAGIAVLLYVWSLRPLIEAAPWPKVVRSWLTRFYLIRKY